MAKKLREEKTLHPENRVTRREDISEAFSKIEEGFFTDTASEPDYPEPEPTATERVAPAAKPAEPARAEKVSDLNHQATATPVREHSRGFRKMAIVLALIVGAGLVVSQVVSPKVGVMQSLITVPMTDPAPTPKAKKVTVPQGKVDPTPESSMQRSPSPNGNPETKGSPRTSSPQRTGTVAPRTTTAPKASAPSSQTERPKPPAYKPKPKPKPNPGPDTTGSGYTGAGGTHANEPTDQGHAGTGNRPPSSDNTDGDGVSQDDPVATYE